MLVYMLTISHKNVCDEMTVHSSITNAMEYMHSYVEYWIEEDCRNVSSEVGSKERIIEYMSYSEESYQIRQAKLDAKFSID